MNAVNNQSDKQSTSRNMTPKLVLKDKVFIFVLFFPTRPKAMVGSSCCSLVALGYQGILAGGCSDAAVATHDWETDLCHGEGILSSTCPRLHGRHPVGASRDPAERCVFLIRTARSNPSVYLEYLINLMHDYFHLNL